MATMDGRRYMKKNMNKYIDTHAHYGHGGFRRLNKSIDELLNENA